ncbi:MAG: UbiD family decarboxylase, partial [Candidatus Binataceae bacterium]
MNQAGQRTAVANDLREFMKLLEREGELRRVSTEVDWRYEIGAMSRMVCERQGPAPLFENVKDYPNQPVAAVLFGPGHAAPLARIALTLGLEKTTPALEVIEALRERFKNPQPPVTVPGDRAACKEVVLRGDDIDLLRFPVPWIKEIDGGRYIGTWDIVIAKDPDTGWINWGTYRCMLKDKRSYAVLLLPQGQHGGAILRKYEQRGEPMPVALVIGADPASHLAASAPLEHGTNEREIAGGIRGSGLELVKCETNDLEVPANAEIVIEGEVMPGERVDEGPFGEYTGHSVAQGRAPLVRVTCITHRKNPVFTMANMGKLLDDSAYCVGPMSAAVAKNRLEAHGLPVRAIYYYIPEVPVISLKPGPGIKRRIVATLLSGERMVTSGIVFVDEDVDPSRLDDVWWAITTRMHPESFEFMRGAPMNALHPLLRPEDRTRRE